MKMLTSICRAIAPCATALRRRWLILSVAFACWLVSTAAWAKNSIPEPVAPQSKSYLIGYGLVGLGITLGLIVVCRPSSRTTEKLHKEKPEED